MQSKATTPEQYIEALPEGRKHAVQKLRQVMADNLPEGFTETMGYGMISYVVPHSVYPPGYHANPKLPLPYISIASQKDYIVLHHLGLYGDKDLLEWFTREYPKHSKTKLNMGKGCVRFKDPEKIPLELIAELAGKITAAEWIRMYESAFKKK